MARMPRTPLQRAAAIAARQQALLTTGQALACGLSYDQLTRLVQVGGWERVAHGLYAPPGSVPSRRRDAVAAVLLAGRGAVASHLTAAALWGLCPFPPLPHVTVPRSASARTPLGRVHRSDLVAADQATRDGVRCTSASRTLVDCAGLVERGVLEEFVDNLLCGQLASGRSVLAAAERARTAWAPWHRNAR